MKFKQLHELVNEGDDQIQKFTEYPRMHETNTLRNAMENEARKDFEKWWDNEEVGNHKFPSIAVRDACKNCALNAWIRAQQFYEIDSKIIPKHLK